MRPYWGCRNTRRTKFRSARFSLSAGAGEENVYLSSADWMGRNSFGRIELCIPVLDRKLQRRVIHEGLKPYLTDNSQAWEMDADGDYWLRRSRGGIPRSAQDHLLAMLASE